MKCERVYVSLPPDKISLLPPPKKKNKFGLTPLGRKTIAEVLTGIRTSEKSCSEADLVRPADRVDSNVASDERWVEEMIAFNVLVRITAELLTNIASVIVRRVATGNVRESLSVPVENELSIGNRDSIVSVDAPTDNNYVFTRNILDCDLWPI